MESRTSGVEDMLGQEGIDFVVMREADKGGEEGGGLEDTAD